MPLLSQLVNFKILHTLVQNLPSRHPSDDKRRGSHQIAYAEVVDNQKFIYQSVVKFRITLPTWQKYVPLLIFIIF